jgi:bifunctional non-homologous end joining protein LigD
MAAPRDITTRVGHRTLTLTNLDKVLYPSVGFTKAEVIDYYARIAPVMLPHIRDRVMTRLRFPDGVGAERAHGHARLGTPGERQHQRRNH